MALLLLLAGVAPTEAGVGLPEIASVQIGPHQVHVLNDSIGLRTGRNTLTVHIPDLPAGYGAALALHGSRGEVVDVPLRSLLVLGNPGAGHGPGPAAPAPDPSSGDGALAHVGHVDTVRDQAPAAHDHAAPSGTVAAAAAFGGRAHGDAHSHGATPPGSGADGHAAHGAPAQGSPSHDDHGSAVTGAGAAARGAAGDGEVPHGAGHGGVTLAGYAVRGVVTLPSTGTWRAVLTIGDGRGEALTGEFWADVTADGPNPVYLGLMTVLIGGSVLYGVIRRPRGQGSR